MVDATLATMIMEAERRAVEKLDYDTQTETTFQCPVCGGTAHLAFHEWLGHSSYCDNHCF